MSSRGEENKAKGKSKKAKVRDKAPSSKYQITNKFQCSKQRTLSVNELLELRYAL
jgi:hypothetical protein